MTTKELDKDTCPIDKGFADYIVCVGCPYNKGITDSEVKCAYAE